MHTARTIYAVHAQMKRKMGARNAKTQGACVRIVRGNINLT